MLGRAAVGAALLCVATTFSCVPADSAAPTIGKRAPEYGGTTLYEVGEVVLGEEGMNDELHGLVIAEELIDPETGDVLVEAADEIDQRVMGILEGLGTEKIEVRQEGKYVSLESMEGKVVLLNLWATWCAPCRHETPFLQSLYEERQGDGLEIVGISMDTGDAGDLVEEFVGEYGVTYTILLDPQMRGMELYQVLGLPATFLIDRDGTLTWMRFGPVGETDTDFLNALDAALE
jgi:peroxiredoxin